VAIPTYERVRAFLDDDKLAHLLPTAANLLAKVPPNTDIYSPGIVSVWDGKLAVINYSILADKDTYDKYLEEENEDLFVAGDEPNVKFFRRYTVWYCLTDADKTIPLSTQSDRYVGTRLHIRGDNTFVFDHSLWEVSLTEGRIDEPVLYYVEVDRKNLSGGEIAEYAWRLRERKRWLDFTKVKDVPGSKYWNRIFRFSTLDDALDSLSADQADRTLKAVRSALLFAAPSAHEVLDPFVEFVYTRGVFSLTKAGNKFRLFVPRPNRGS